MENSTKALIMAAEVIVGILLLTVFIWVFRKGSEMLENVDNSETSEAIAAYNSKLDIYNRKSYIAEDGTKHDYYNTIFDIVTACNLAYEINNQNEFDDKNYLIIELKLDTVTYTLKNSEEQKKGYIGDSLSLTDLIKEYGKRINTSLIPNEYNWDYEYKFKGETFYDSDTGKINKIFFEEES